MNLRDELTRIYEENGRLTPALVVDAWRDESSPFHTRLEWDDGVAGEAWRREQAHRMIRTVKIVYRRPDTDQKLELRAFHAVASPTLGHVFEPLETIVADPLKKAILLRDMEREWRQMHARYASFAEFYELVRRDIEAAG